MLYDKIWCSEERILKEMKTLGIYKINLII